MPFPPSFGKMLNKKSRRKRLGEFFRSKPVLKKWLNIGTKDSDFSADEEADSETDFEDYAEFELCEADRRLVRFLSSVSISDHVPYKSRRRKSETMRAQYINTKELRLCVGTWNVGGRIPPDDLEIEEWLDMNEPSDIYVLGLQEIVPLNAGNVLGVEDSRPVPRWESLIRQTINKVKPAKTKFKSHTAPPSPSDISDSVSDSDGDGDGDGDEQLRINPIDIEDDSFENPQSSDHSFVVSVPKKTKHSRTLSNLERFSLSWPEQCLDLSQHQKMLKADNFNSQSAAVRQLGRQNSIIYKKRKSWAYVRVISKQMVGIFISVWVRRGLRKYIQNMKISTVGVGVMGYIGNKGSISISMSIYQTMFCFVCCHLSSGEKESDRSRRNTDVQEIHRRTQFNTSSSGGLPRTIHDHERIVWLGDLNYRMNSSLDRAHQLISKKDWPNLSEFDQLKSELKKGRAFDGWTEGIMTFPPTYKYQVNSENYDVRRTPAWCDRILSYGKGMKLMSYKTSDVLDLSDHKPVTAIYLAEVEVFSQKCLQRALTFTKAELENCN